MSSQEIPIKIERYILVTRQGFGFLLQPAHSRYILIPSEIDQRLFNDYDINFRDPDLEKKCSLVREREGEQDIIRLVYEFRRVPSGRVKI